MHKHIRDAIRMAGVPGVEVYQGGKHMYVVVNGKRIPCASSPKNADHTAKNLAKDIRSAAQ